MNIELTAHEARVLGSLMEKAVTTPDQCPLTVNSLMLACNQKSSRDPVMTLDQATVQRTARDLEVKHLAKREENFRTGVEKYSQRFCNTPFNTLQLSDAEYAVICLLLLRGQQTPGELRTRSGRLWQFAENTDVAATLQGLIDREGGPLIARLSRTAGRQDHEYMHQFFGVIQSVPLETQPTPVAKPTADRSPHTTASHPADNQGGDRISQLESQVQVLEQELAELKEMLADVYRGQQPRGESS